MGALDGQVAIVTGGNRGIGRAIAQTFAAAGATVVIAARDQARTAEVLGALEQCGQPGLGVACDIAQAADRSRLLTTVRERYGKLNVLVNNAAFDGRQPTLEVTEAIWAQVLATNLTALFFLCQGAYPLLVAAGGGKIINLSSDGPAVGQPGAIAYAASKAGVEAVTRTLAREWGPDRIQANVLVPGITRTEMSARLANPAVEAFVASRLPAGRVGEPEDVAAGALFLASAGSNYMTGHTLVLDGGLLVADAFRR